MPQYSKAMELVQEDVGVQAARQPLDILLNKYGLRLNPASIWLEVGEDGMLVLPAGLVSLPCLKMHFPGDEYPQALLDHNHFHTQFRAPDGKLRVAMQCWGIVEEIRIATMQECTNSRINSVGTTRSVCCFVSFLCLWVKLCKSPCKPHCIGYTSALSTFCASDFAIGCHNFLLCCHSDTIQLQFNSTLAPKNSCSTLSSQVVFLHNIVTCNTLADRSLLLIWFC